MEEIQDNEIRTASQKEFQKQKDHEADLQRLRGFRPIDDIFMRSLFRENLPLAEYVLQVIMQKKDLRLISEQTQKDMSMIAGARAICLDVHGEDDEKVQYDIEVQRDDGGASPERVRYHASVLDVANLKPSQDFKELPTTYIIMITEHDLFKRGKPIYPIVKTIGGTAILNEQGDVIEPDLPFDDRRHILYVNASYQGDDEIGRLMHDFLCADPDDMYVPLMAERTRYLKTHPEGVETMCKAMEEMRDDVEQRTILEAIKNLMRNTQWTAQQAMDALSIPPENQTQYSERLQ